MRQHGALRAAGGARSIENGREIVGAALGVFKDPRAGEGQFEQAAFFAGIMRLDPRARLRCDRGQRLRLWIIPLSAFPKLYAPIKSGAMPIPMMIW